MSIKFKLPTSWDDMNMDWNNPNPLEYKYYYAIWKAARERTIELFNQDTFPHYMQFDAPCQSVQYHHYYNLWCYCIYMLESFFLEDFEDDESFCSKTSVLIKPIRWTIETASEALGFDLNEYPLPCMSVNYYIEFLKRMKRIVSLCRWARLDMEPQFVEKCYKYTGSTTIYEGFNDWYNSNNYLSSAYVSNDGCLWQHYVLWQRSDGKPQFVGAGVVSIKTRSYATLRFNTTVRRYLVPYQNYPTAYAYNGMNTEYIPNYYTPYVFNDPCKIIRLEDVSVSSGSKYTFEYQIDYNSPPILPYESAKKIEQKGLSSLMLYDVLPYCSFK